MFVEQQEMFKRRNKMNDNPITDEELDKLLEIYCEGIYDMDPKTALPFWDYDFGPLFGDLWIKRMIKAIKIIKTQFSPKEVAKLFNGIAVPRKELIYSLVDLKVGDINKEDRKEFVNFWWDIIREKCANEDYLCENKTNLIHSKEEIKELMKKLNWNEHKDKKIGKEMGKISMSLNSLSYGLYSDIFAHNCFENFGPYKISGNEIFVVKTWTNLQPVEIWPETKDFKFKDIKIYCIYKDMDYTVDIYNHQWYSANTVDNLVKVALVIDGKEILVANDEDNIEKLREITKYLAEFAVEQFHKYKKEGFEKNKALWVMQRSYQFKEFFRLAGLEWNGPEMQEMLTRVKDKPVLNNPYWDFSYPKERLFRFWKKCFDPRLDTYFSKWEELFEKEVKTKKGVD